MSYVRSPRTKYKKTIANARFVLQRSPYAFCIFLLIVLTPLVLILMAIRPFAFPRATLPPLSPASQPYVDPCTTAQPAELRHFDPSRRAARHYAEDTVRALSADPPSFHRVFAAFFGVFLFQPASDVVSTLNTTERGRPVDIRDTLVHAQRALRAFYADPSLVVQNYSLGYDHLDRVRGSRYVLHLKTANASTPHLHHAVALQRTFDGACFLSVRHYPQTVFDSPVHIVLPYAQRPKRLTWFLDQFEYLISSSVNVRLIISVCKHNETDVAHVEKIARKSESHAYITVVKAAGDQTNYFSRAISIREAVKYVPRDSIFFISDVDMYIFPMLFDSCRYNAIQGSQVFFPVFYSLFARNDRISRSGGYWRDSSLGMSCMYRSDFDEVHAYDNAESAFMGWGMEDRVLCEAFKNDSRYEVFRAVEPALRHKWHLKHCEPLTPAYEDCLSVTFQQLGDMKSVGRFLLENHFDTQKFFAKFADDDEDESDTGVVAQDVVGNSTDAKETQRRKLRKQVLRKNQEIARERILAREKQREIEWRKQTGISEDEDEEAFKEHAPPGLQDENGDGDRKNEEGLAKDKEMMEKEDQKQAMQPKAPHM